MDDVGAAFADKLRVVRDDIDRFALRAQQPEKLCDLKHVAVIKVRRRFIQHEHARLHHESAAAGDLLLFPAGEAEDAAAKQPFEMQRGSRFLQTAQYLRRGYAEVFTALPPESISYIHLTGVYFISRAARRLPPRDILAPIRQRI